jgi:hypothetical protein
MARENNVAIYRDTIELINGYMPYKKSTEESIKNTVVYPENFKVGFKGDRGSNTVITVVNQGTIGVGLELARLRGTRENEESTWGKKGNGKKVVCHRDMLKVTVIGCGIGILIISGFVFNVITSIIELIQKIT